MTAFRRKRIDPKQLPEAVVSKWNTAVLCEGFVPFPKTLMRKLIRIFTGSKRLTRLTAMLAVIDYKRPHLARPPSLEYLAFNAGMSTERFRRALGQMQEDGWIRIGGTDNECDVDTTPFLAILEQEIEEEGA
jgi:hypothetical protein